MLRAGPLLRFLIRDLHIVGRFSRVVFPVRPRRCHETDHDDRCMLSPCGRSRGRGCSRHRVPAGGQSIQPARSHTSLKPSGSVSARRQQSAGLGPPASSCERSSPWSFRSDFGSHFAIGHIHAGVHSEDQTKEKEEASPPGVHCTPLALPQYIWDRWCRRDRARLARLLNEPSMCALLAADPGCFDHRTPLVIFGAD